MWTMWLGCAGTATFITDDGHVDRPAPPPTATRPTDTLPAFFGEAPKNLLMISIDTTRKDHISAYGDLGLTPFLDSLMKGGYTLDDHAQCSNWTYPGTTCVQLGRSHTDMGFLPALPIQFQAIMPDTPTLASWLKDAGFQTALWTTNSWFSGQWRSNQGFDVTTLKGGALETLIAEAATTIQASEAAGVERWYVHIHGIEPHPAYNPPESYLDGLDGLDPIPFDLSSFEQHYDATGAWPYLTPEEQALLLEHLTVRYHGEIRYFDDQLAAAWADLDSRGLLDDTLVVIWNDHGESFWEHGHQTHAWTLHTQENDAFAVFWAKNIVPGSWKGPTQALDLAPTLLSLWDIPLAEEITGYAVGTAPADRARFIWSWARNGVDQAILKDGWRLMFDWKTKLELYDDVSDPENLTDLYDPDHPVAEALWPLLAEEMARMEPLTTPVVPELPVPAP